MCCNVKMCCYVLHTTTCLYVRLCLTMSWYLKPCVSVCCFVWLYLTIYEGVLLCVTMCCYVWSAICKNVLLCSALWRCVAMCCLRLCVCMCDYALLWADIWDHACVTMRCFVWVSVTIYEGVFLCVMMCCYVWSATYKNALVCSAMWRCVAMCCLRLCVGMCDYALLWADIWDHVLLCAALREYL
jgi:hypothetical protein